MTQPLPLFEETPADAECELCRTDPYADGLCVWCWFQFVARPEMLAAEAALSERLKRIRDEIYDEVDL